MNIYSFEDTSSLLGLLIEALPNTGRVKERENAFPLTPTYRSPCSSTIISIAFFLLILTVEFAFIQIWNSMGSYLQYNFVKKKMKNL